MTAVVAPGRRPRPMTPEAILRQVVVEDHALAPDGVVRGRRPAIVEGNGYRSHLWLVPLAGRDAGPWRGNLAARDVGGPFAPWPTDQRAP